MATQNGLEEHAEEAAGIDAGMIVETHVFGGDKGIDQIGRQLVIGDVGTVLKANIAQHLSVIADDLRGLQAMGILNVFKLRHVANPSDGEEEEKEKDKSPEPSEGPPHVFDVFRAFARGSIFFHRLSSCCCILS